MINLSKLSKDMGMLDIYFESEQTKRFLNTLNKLVLYTKIDMIKTKNENELWAHPLVVQNYSQFISIEFSAYVCSAIYEYFLTMKDRHTKETESIWKYEYNKLYDQLNKTKNELTSLTEHSKDDVNYTRSLILKLRTKIEKLKMRRSHPKLDTGHCVYIYIYHNKLVESNHYKVGISSDINETLAQARRNAPYTLLDFVIYLSESQYKLVEQMIKIKFSDKRNSRTHEVIDDSLEEIIKGILSICDTINIKHRLAEQYKIDAYNEFIEMDTSDDEDIN